MRGVLFTTLLLLAVLLTIALFGLMIGVGASYLAHIITLEIGAAPVMIFFMLVSLSLMLVPFDKN